MDTQRVEEWMSLHGQRQRLVETAKRTVLLDQARYYAALVQLAREPAFTIVLEHIFQNLFLLPENVPGTAENIGRQSVYWGLLKDLRMAQDKSTAYAAEANRL